MKKFLQHLLIPHQSNNHRAKLLHHHSLLILTILVFISSFFIQSIQKEYPSVLGISANVSIDDLLSLTNKKRQEKGLPPLNLNTHLSQAAAMKAHDMFGKNYWAHIAPDGTTPWVFIKNSGYEYLYAGENLARGFNNTPEVVNAWMESPSHRENMLSPHYNDIGFAVVPGSLTGSDTVLVVEMFGSQYIAKDSTPSEAALGAALPSPTISNVKQLARTASPVPSITTPTETQITPFQAEANSVREIAASSNNPLIDSKSMTRQISFFIILFIIALLIMDVIIIKRKKIVRVVSHNLDHIFFLAIILITAIIIGKGVIL